MIPKLLHDIDRNFDALNVFGGLDNEIGFSKLIGILSEVSNLVLEGSELIENEIELVLGSGRTARVLLEISLLHVLGKLCDSLLKLLDVSLVLFLLVGHEGLNLLGHFLGGLLEINPLLANLVE
jgi:hypothetical protein